MGPADLTRHSSQSALLHKGLGSHRAWHKLLIHDMSHARSNSKASGSLETRYMVENRELFKRETFSDELRNEARPLEVSAGLEAMQSSFREAD